MTTGHPNEVRDEGQWAVGTREPLNPTREMKQAGAPLEVRERIKDNYAQNGFGSIDKGDLRGRFRWWGLYPHCEQGYNGTWTGDENICSTRPWRSTRSCTAKSASLTSPTCRASTRPLSRSSTSTIPGTGPGYVDRVTRNSIRYRSLGEHRARRATRAYEDERR